MKLFDAPGEGGVLSCRDKVAAGHIVLQWSADHLGQKEMWQAFFSEDDARVLIAALQHAIDHDEPGTVYQTVKEPKRIATRRHKAVVTP